MAAVVRPCSMRLLYYFMMTMFDSRLSRLCPAARKAVAAFLATAEDQDPLIVLEWQDHLRVWPQHAGVGVRAAVLNALAGLGGVALRTLTTGVNPGCRLRPGPSKRSGLQLARRLLRAEARHVNGLAIPARLGGLGPRPPAAPPSSPTPALGWPRSAARSARGAVGPGAAALLAWRQGAQARRVEKPGP